MNSTIGSTLDHAKEIEVKLGNETYIVNPLTLTDVHTHFESKIRANALADAKEVAAQLPKEERIEFMTRVWKELPKGEAVDAQVSELIQSMGGIQECIFKALLNIGASITLDIVKKYVNIDTLDQFLDVFYGLIGYEADDDEEEAEEPTRKKS